MALMKDKFALEAARAAVLATHAAAGLATGTSSREVMCLLRLAEALARSAVALLSTPTTTSSSSGTSTSANGARVVPPAGAGDGTPGANSARHRRRGGRNKKQQTETMNVDAGHVEMDRAWPRRVVLVTAGSVSVLEATPRVGSPDVNECSPDMSVYPWIHPRPLRLLHPHRRTLMVPLVGGRLNNPS